jgi:hypothetical protein
MMRRDPRAYSTTPIVRAMARLFAWTELACGPAGDRVVARWSIPASEAGARGDAD